MIDTIESLKARRNGRQARPNIRYRDARETTDAFLRAAGGLDTDRPRVAWWRRLKVYELALLVLSALGLLVVVLNGIR